MNTTTDKKFAGRLQIIKSLAANYQILKASPSLNLFLLQYLNKFKILDVGGRLVLHSHLPPINSKSYARFIKEHLTGKSNGPSHAQIGLTNACPQNCEYCYNKHRKGKVMDTATIIKLIQDLKRMGVFWIGFTGGEPLLNKDIVRITESAGDDCTVKLFTTGCTLTKQKALDLKKAGLSYVSVSLDHWQEDIHDKTRRYKSAFQTALNAIDIFRETGDLHISVSSVLSKEMIQQRQVETFLQFLIGLDIHEAWLSEAKPSVEAFWNENQVITEDERLYLSGLQDKYNKQEDITVNYLGHFEGREHFGCNAGHKMVYIDAFGEVSPCVFTPMTFGNVMDSSIESLFPAMKEHFPSDSACFINKNYQLFQKYLDKNGPVNRRNSLSLMQEVQFGQLSRFFQLYYH